MEILINYVKPDIEPILPSPQMILSFLEGVVTPTSHKIKLNANIKKGKIKNK
jgi:hypothetical protein